LKGSPVTIVETYTNIGFGCKYLSFKYNDYQTANILGDAIHLDV